MKIVITLQSFFLYASVIAFPFYIFESGRIQISGYLVLISFLLMMSKLPALVLKYKLVHSLLIFVAYSILINATYSILYSTTSALVYSAFYLHGLISLTIILYLFSKNSLKVWNSLFYVFTLSLLVQFSLSFNVGFLEEYSRSVIFFNNPNQLGYYSLSSLIITLICYSNSKKINRYLVFFPISLSLYLSMLSLSKGAIIAVLLSLFIFILSNFKPRKIIKHITVYLIVLVSLFFIIQKLNPALLDYSYERVLLTGSDNDDNLISRGYNRIWENQGYLLFGAGEGNLNRWFNETQHSIELHSTIGTIIFSYGLTGLLLWLNFIYGLIKKSDNNMNIYYIIPVLVYGIAHNGLRSTFFWMLLGILIASAHSKRHHLSL